MAANSVARSVHGGAAFLCRKKKVPSTVMAKKSAFLYVRLKHGEETLAKSYLEPLEEQKNQLNQRTKTGNKGK